jgi:hypothetical protein
VGVGAKKPRLRDRGGLGMRTPRAPLLRRFLSSKGAETKQAWRAGCGGLIPKSVRRACLVEENVKNAVNCCLAARRPARGLGRFVLAGCARGDNRLAGCLVEESVKNAVNCCLAAGGPARGLGSFVLASCARGDNRLAGCLVEESMKKAVNCCLAARCPARGLD